MPPIRRASKVPQIIRYSGQHWVLLVHDACNQSARYSALHRHLELDRVLAEFQLGTAKFTAKFALQMQTKPSRMSEGSRSSDGQLAPAGTTRSAIPHQEKIQFANRNSYQESYANFDSGRRIIRPS